MYLNVICKYVFVYEEKYVGVRANYYFECVSTSPAITEGIYIVLCCTTI